MADPFPSNSPIENQELYEAYETGSINTPPAQNFNTPAMDGSLQQFLADNLGSYVVVEFLIGTGFLIQKAGILYAMGSSILTLYEEISQTFVTCDIFSVKFVTFYLPGHRPWQMSNPLFAQSGVGSPNFFPSGVPIQSGPPIQFPSAVPAMPSAQTMPSIQTMPSTQGMSMTEPIPTLQGAPTVRPPAFSRPQ